MDNRVTRERLLRPGSWRRETILTAPAWSASVAQEGMYGRQYSDHRCSDDAKYFGVPVIPIEL